MRKRRFHIMRPCQRPFLQARRWRPPSNAPELAPRTFRVGARGDGTARPLCARLTRANSVKRRLTTQCTPRSKKNSRRSKGGGENARAVALGPLLAARLRQLAGGTQRALLDAAHTQGLSIAAIQ